ncbi:MAG: DNA polymerase III subunit alpha [Alphaproteobacteria bacterium]|nr:DNA polymerase III subunit alpha [Alphaproteobacteria bacterium]
MESFRALAMIDGAPMSHADFVHLRVHSAYSLSEGAISIRELIALCRTHDMPAVAVTDSGNLFGAMEFALAAAPAGVQPIIGCQLLVETRPAQGAKARGGPPPDPLLLLVQNETGYRNLLALVSQSFLETDPGDPPHVALGDLSGRSEGLLALTGGPAGAVGRLLGEGQDEAAAATLGELARLFPARLYIELHRHGLDIERRVEPGLLELAYRHDLPLIATNEVFFAGEDKFEAHDALLCIEEKSVLSDSERRRVTPEHRFKSAADMRAAFADLPEAVDNTLVVARRCAYMPEVREPILPPFESESGRSEPEELEAQARGGLEERLKSQVFTPEMPADAREVAAQPYWERLDFELDVIVRMGFAGYFLIVADFIRWAKSQGIPVGPGRGSGAGSLVAWSLSITDLDPLRWGLLFERFLNPDRVSMPDFDIDFCQDRRDEVIRYVQGKYGRDHVAQIITFGSLQARAALRDVGRVLEMPYGQVDRICKLVPNNPANPVKLRQAIDEEPRLQEMQAEDSAVARLLDIALKLEGLYRHASTHAAGLVIGDRPLEELIPLYRDPRSAMPVTQFSMKYVESAGLVKFDFLGLKTLTVLARTCELLRLRGVELDLQTLPLHDDKTYEMLSRGDTIGVFQFESAGMRSLLRDAQVGNFEDIVALVALFRPGPMENIPKYIACKHGREQPEFLHETIEPVVADTYGVIIYQEQVMQIAQVFAGFTLAQADILRKAMGKKIKSEMAAQRDAFIDGAVARGVPKDRASYVFDLVDKFAGYGFNKAHSAGYGLVAYQTAYLKANYPVEFLAASMTYDMGNTDKLNIFRQELDRLGIPLLPPDINRSEPVFSVETADGEGLAIRYALAAVRNVGRQAMEDLVAERGRAGPFRDLGDLARRVDSQTLNKRQLENLACAGAFDGLEPSRARAFAAAETIMRHASAAATERSSDQTSLFGGEDEASPRMLLPTVPDWSQLDALQREYDAIGFYLSAHPLDGYQTSLERLGVTPAAALPDRVRAAGGAIQVKLAGTVLGKKERTSQRGNRFAFVTLSDTSGMYEATVFAELLAQARDLIEAGAPLLLSGEARLEGDQPKFLAQSIDELDRMVAGTAIGLRIYAGDAGALESLKSVVERTGEGRGRVSLILALGDREVELELARRLAVSAPLRGAIKAIPGVRDVQEI